MSPLISSSILGTYQPAEFIFQCSIFLPFHTVHGVLKARTQKWFAISFSSGPHFVSSIKSAKTRLGADCGSYHEHLIAKFKLKLNKVGKTNGPFMYDLNQNPYDYTVEVRNRFKGLELIEYLINYWWSFMTLYRRQGFRIPQEKEIKKKTKWLSEEALQTAVKRKEAKSKGEKERYTHLNAEFQRIARRDKRAFLTDQCKEI